MTYPAVVLACVAMVGAVLCGPAVVCVSGLALHRPAPLGFSGDAATVAIAGVTLAGLAASPEPATAFVGLPLVGLGTAAAVVDTWEYRLPDELTGPLLTSTATVLVLVSLGIGDTQPLLPAAAAAVGLTGVGLALKALRNDAVGWGDLKLTPSLGAVLGWVSWPALLTAVFVWILLLGLTALGMARSGQEHQVVPYGPALLAGALGGLAAGG